MKPILPILLAVSALALTAAPASAQYGQGHRPDDRRPVMNDRDHHDRGHHRMQRHHRHKVCWVRHHHRVCKWR